MWGRGQQQAASFCLFHVWGSVSESAGSWKCPLTSDHPENQRLCSEQETPSLNLTLPFGNLSTDGRNRVSFLLSAWGCSAPEWTQSDLQSVCPNLWPSCFPLRCVSEAQTVTAWGVSAARLWCKQVEWSWTAPLMRRTEALHPPSV